MYSCLPIYSLVLWRSKSVEDENRIHLLSDYRRYAADVHRARQLRLPTSSTIRDLLISSIRSNMYLLRNFICRVLDLWKGRGSDNR
jgi:hypothetical protein